ncbi:MAG: Rdx family protein [Thermomicrobia bacterium]|nr:Rdx family protein [Thermomicrobia bacterium]MCA1723858.1 Rdx family protein [Thermomicrobia bacterium]
MADTLLHDYKNQIGALTFLPSSGGVFEITVNGSLIHSKKESDQFPDEEAVVKRVGELVGA